MPILALDFDGVICDSAREVFMVGLHTYASMNPGSEIVRAVEQRPNRRSWQTTELATEPVFQQFFQLMPFGNRAEDYGVALRAIEQSAQLTNQSSYEAFRTLLDSSWLEEFHRLFYEHRAALRADINGWLALHSPYGPFIDLLKQRAGQAQYAIATAKDSASVKLLLQHFGIAELFKPDLILDKNTGIEKTAHLEELTHRTNARLEEITFLDDKVRHLLAVLQLGVRPVLAGWGYNTQREYDVAAQHGLAVADFDNAGELLFGEPGNTVLQSKQSLQ